MRIISIFVLLVIFLSCNQQKGSNASLDNDTAIIEEYDTEIPDETATDPATERDFSDPPDTEEEMWAFLKDYLTPNQVRIFINAYDNYPIMKTDEELARFYLVNMDTMIRAINQGMWKSHPDVEWAGDSEPADAWAWINDFYPYIKTECPCSECESGAFAYLTELMDKAGMTLGEEDDAFFDALYAFYGTPQDDYNLVDAGNQNNWFTMDGCDFCSYNNLGDGNYTNMLKKTIAVENCSDLFDNTLRSLIERTMYIEYTSHFGKPKEDVLAEIDVLLQLQGSTQFDLSNLEKLKIRIDTSQNIQYNCANEACEYEF